MVLQSLHNTRTVLLGRTQESRDDSHRPEQLNSRVDRGGKVNSCEDNVGMYVGPRPSPRGYALIHGHSLDFRQR